MSSNKELITEVNELASALGKSVRTWGLSNTELQALADDLRRQKEQTGGQSAGQGGQAGGQQPGGQTESSDDDEKKEKAKSSGEDKDKDEDDGEEYVIAPGTSLTSARGILGPGTKVSAKDFTGGKKTLDDLIKNKSVVKG